MYYKMGEEAFVLLMKKHIYGWIDKPTPFFEVG